MKINDYIKQFYLDKVFPSNIVPFLQLKSYIKGEIILEAKSIPKAVYFIVKGEVEIRNFLSSGRYMFINNLSPLEIFGDVEFLSGDSILFDVIANTDTEVIILPFNVIKKHLEENPYFWKLMAKEGNSKLLRTNKSVILKNSYDLKTIFASYLVKNTYYVEFKSLSDLAEHLNVSYRNLTRIIKEFKENGYIEKNRNSINVIRKDIILEMTLYI
jgi:CRP-like cAMP-binding protein